MHGDKLVRSRIAPVVDPGLANAAAWIGIIAGVVYFLEFTVIRVVPRLKRRVRPAGRFWLSTARIGGFVVVGGGIALGFIGNPEWKVGVAIIVFVAFVAANVAEYRTWRANAQETPSVSPQHTSGVLRTPSPSERPLHRIAAVPMASRTVPLPWHRIDEGLLVLGLGRWSGVSLVRQVVCVVTNPRGVTTSCSVDLPLDAAISALGMAGGSVVSVHYPVDFGLSESVSPGRYSVVWSLPQHHAAGASKEISYEFELG